MGSDKAARGAERLEDRRGFLHDDGIAREDEIKRPLPRLRDAGGHARLDGVGAGLVRGLFDFEVDLGRDGGEVDEDAPLRAGEEVVGGEDAAHGGVIGDDGQDDVGVGGDVGELFRRGAVEFLGQILRGLAAYVVNRADRKALFHETARHVCAHASDADHTDFLPFSYRS